jgi:hypothetical protein
MASFRASCAEYARIVVSAQYLCRSIASSVIRMFVWCFVERTTSTASFFSFPMYQEGASRRIDVGSDQRLAPRNLVSRWSLGNPFLQCHSLGLKEAHAEMSEANRAEARDMKNGVSFGACSIVPER